MKVYILEACELMADGQVELPRSSSQGFIMSSEPHVNGIHTPPSPSSDHDEVHHPLGCSTSTPVIESKEKQIVSKTSSVLATHSTAPRRPPSGSRRSASDGAVPDYSISPELDTKTPERCRSHSDSDERAAGLRARINEKYDQLERELRPNRGRFQRATNGDSSSSSPTTEGPDSPAVMRLSDSLDGDFALDGHLTADDTCVLSSGSPALTMVELRANDPHHPRRPRSVSVAEVKELAYARLQAELNKAQQELKLKDEEVARLSQIRDEVGAELEDLTASLFEEANNMVREANIKQAAAEKRLKESNLKMEVLQAEVQALKTLMITSTPSRPNPHLHPQLGKSNSGGGGHRRSPSNYELSSISSLARRSPPTQSPPPPNPGHVADDYIDFNPELYEVDPVYHKEFVAWRQNPQLDSSDPFLARIYREDIVPCLHFAADDLTQEVLKSIENNSITIEAVSGNSPFPKKCSLLDAPRLCKYRMKLGDSSNWHYISQLCRNRITSVCDFFCYLRYIQQGLVRNGIHEVYWEVIRRRRSIALARLGIGSAS